MKHATAGRWLNMQTFGHPLLKASTSPSRAENRHAPGAAPDILELPVERLTMCHTGKCRCGRVPGLYGGFTRAVGCLLQKRCPHPPSKADTQGVCHRELNLESALLHRRDARSALQVKVCDFGLSRVRSCSRHCSAISMLLTHHRAGQASGCLQEPLLWARSAWLSAAVSREQPRLQV